MDKQQLEAYRSNKDEIIELQQKLRELSGSESLIDNSVILDYRKGYPQPRTIVGYDHGLEERRRERWTKRIELLQAEVDEVEKWIEAIPDGITRRCFRLVYIEGLTQRKTARKMHMDKSTVGRKISEYLKVAPNAPNAPL
jgi:DNA-directed RNA polymerase specialized sigma24 family protein